MSTVGQLLRAAREQRGYTRKELSEKSGISLNTLYAYEHDKSEPTVYKLIDIADSLDMSLDRLLGHKRPSEKRT